MKQRLLALLLALVMAFALTPVDPANAVTQTSVTATGTAPTGACDQTGNDLGAAAGNVTAVRISTGACVVTFKAVSSTYTWTVPTYLTSVQVLVVAGGGAGGMRGGAGGGAGGLISSTETVIPTGSVSIAVGAGGAGTATTDNRGGNGGNSFFDMNGTRKTAIGGGGGGTASAYSDTARSGSNGGSGGGSVGNQAGNDGATVGTGTAGQGNAGGKAVNPSSYSNWPAGGGGGAGGVGQSPANNNNGGNGGTGVASSITGTNTCYATGGGGGINAGYTGGLGGTCSGFANSINGGNGQTGSNTPATPTANTGAGGGGSGYSAGADVKGGDGASGVVIISYMPPSPTPTFSATTAIGKNGFKFYVTNYVVANGFTYSATTSAGIVTMGVRTTAGATYLPFIVSGLNAGQSATISVTVSKTLYGTTSASISGTAAAAAAATTCAPTSTVVGKYTRLTFKATSATVDSICNWTVPSNVPAATTILVVGGGGGGGYYGNGGSGGAGALLVGSGVPLTPSATMTLTVGSAGAGSGGGPGASGNNSAFGSIIAVGGGGGAGGDSSHGDGFCSGLNGGSGGGGDNECLPMGSPLASVGGTSVAASLCACSSPVWAAFGNSGAGGVSGGGGGGAGGAGSGGSGGAPKTVLGSSYAAGYGATADTGAGAGAGATGAAGVIIIQYLTPATTTADLARITPSTQSLSPAFDPAVYSYTMNVPNSVSSITMTPLVGENGGTAKVNGTTVTTNTASGAIALNVGANTVTVSGVASDGTTTSTYTITVTRWPSNNANLSGLTTDAGAISPTFVNSTTAYSVTYSYATTSVTVTPTIEDPFSTMTVNGTTLASGTASAAIAVSGANTTINIVVTAEDGTTQKTYVLTATRGAASTTATLSALTSSRGAVTPTFASGTNSYAITIASNATNITFTPTVSDTTATIKVNGTTTASGVASGAIAVSAGTTNISIVVTAQDGTTANTYSVAVTRLANSVATLSNLTSAGGSLSPTFDSATNSYTMTVPYATTTATFTPTLTDTAASVKVNNAVVTSGSASTAQSLALGSNTITVLVTAANGTTTNTYTITVTRTAASTDASLSNLTTSTGTRSPTFSPTTFDYTVNVVNTTTALTVIPTAAGTGATIKVNGSTVTSTQASQLINLAVGVTNVSIVVTAQDGTTTLTYTYAITRAASAVSTLSALSISSGTLSPTFATGTTSYTTSVANSVTSLTVTPTLTATVASVAANGTSVASAAASGAISLNVGSNTITVLVTAEDGTTTSTYTITVTRAASSVATLSSLVLSAGTLSTGFTSGTVNYNASAAYSVSSITLTPTVTDSTATVTVNGTAVSSGSASGAIALAVNSNTITIVVTAQDLSTKTYTITLTRTPASTAKNLSTLTISAGTLSPSFAAGTNTYTASVSNGTTSLTVTPTASGSFSTITVNGTVVASASTSGAISLNVGSNTITLLVTAENGSTNTYTVSVTRAASAVATLSALDVSAGSLSPTFASATTSYAVSVGNSTSSFTVTPTVTDATASVKVNGTTVTSGSASGSIALSVGSNTITVLVTAQDGTTTKSYTITVTRAASAVATLSALTTSTGTLSPTFSASTTAYSFSVANTTSALTVTPTVTDSTASVKVNGTTVTSGSASGSISLSVGSNTINVVVTAQDGTTTSTYTITVNRAASSVATLSALATSSGTLSPTFSSGTTSYSVAVTNATTSISVTPTVTQANATVTVNGSAVTSGSASGSVGLAVGDTTITVVVTAQDGSTTSNYTITVTRAPSAVATLSALSTSSGTLSPTFASGTTSYSVAVSNATTSITVTPTVTQANASVTVNGSAVTSASASTAIALSVGANTITVVVTAQDGSTTSTYTITVNRNQPAPTITSVSSSTPNYGTTVTITGTDFTNVSSVAFGADSMTFTVVNDTTITFTNTHSCCSADVIQVFTPGGTASSASTTSQPQIPSITTQPIAISKSVGQTATFTVVVGAIADGGTISYQWRKGSSVISGANSATYSFTTTAVSDAGNYSVTVTNTIGGNSAFVISTSAALTMSQGVQGTVTLTATSGTFGTDLTLTASGGSGTGTYSYSTNTAGCSIVLDVLTSTSAKTCVVTATRAGDTNYLSKASAATNVVMGKATPTLSGFANVTAHYADGTVTLTDPTVSGSLAGTFTYVSGNLSVATVAGNQVTIRGIGTSVITVTFAPTNSADYNNASTTMTLSLQSSYLAQPNAPNVTATAGSLKSFGVTWTSVTGASSYTITIYRLGSSVAQATGLSGTSTTLTATQYSAMANNTAYTFTITAIGDGTNYLDSVESFASASVTSNQTYAITYDSNAATSGTVPNAGAFITGGSATVIAGNTGALAKTGYNFDGWNTVANGTGTTFAADGSASYSTLAAITLYAKWRALGQSVTFSSNYGTPTTSSQVITAGTATALNANAFTRPGFTFDKWTTNADGTGTAYTDAASITLVSSTTLYAQWAAIHYSVIYNGINASSGVAPVDSATYVNGDTVQLLENTGNLQRTGYDFAGWSVNSNGSGTLYLPTASLPTRVSATKTINLANLTFYAVWSPITYLVNYNSDGGTSVSSGTYQIGGSTNLPAGPTKAGYTFSGWATTQAGTLISGTTYSPPATGTVTLWAVWTPINYTVTYDSNASNSGSVPTDAGIYNVNSVLTLAANSGTLTRAGYTFGGWATNATGTGTVYAAGGSYTFAAADVIFYAVWVPVEYTVTYRDNNATGGTAPTDSATYHVGSSITVAANSGALVRTGYSFGGWATTANGTGTVYSSGTPYVVGIANVMLYAIWSPNTYTVTYVSNGANGTPARTSDSYTTAQPGLTLPGVGTMAKTGYQFTGWSTSANGSLISGAFTTTANVSLYAQWQAIQYTVTYDPNGGSSTPTQTSLTIGQSFTLASGITKPNGPSNEMYAFVGWSNGTSTFQPGYTYVVGSSNIALAAVWVRVFTVSYSLNGSSSAVPADVLKNDGDSVTTANAPSRTGYTFAGWRDQSGQVYTAGSTMVVGLTHYLLYAQWNAINYTVTYAPNGGSTTPQQAAMNIGQSFVVADAIAKTGYGFVGWSDGTNIYGAGSNYTVGSSDITLTAQWTPNRYVVSFDLNGGSGSAVADQTYTVGTTALTLPLVGNHTRTNYTFAGWSTTRQGSTVGLTYSATDNTVLYAVWVRNQYTVSYNVGSGTPTTVSYLAGDPAIQTPTPTKTDFVFKGWYDASSNGNLVALPGASFVPTATATLYAKWVQLSLAGVDENDLSLVGTAVASNTVAQNNTFSTTDSSVSVSIPAGSLPAGTTVSFYLVANAETYAASTVGTGNHVLSLVASWLASNGTVPVTAAGKPITMVITSSSIQKGAVVYSVVGSTVQRLGVALVDGSVTVQLTTDPQIYVVATIADAPSNVTAVALNSTTARVTWDAPASNGGAAVINYQVTASDGQTCTTSNLTCTFSGLSIGVDYTYSVRATNSVGVSASSSTSAAVRTGEIPRATPPTRTPAPEIVVVSVPLRINLDTKNTKLVATEDSGAVVTWSSESKICKVTTDGSLTLVAAGKCSVTAEVTKDDQTAEREFVIDVAPGMSIVTQATTNVQNTKATLNALVGYPNTAYSVVFCYRQAAAGSKCTYVSASPTYGTLDSTTKQVLVSAAISGLQPETDYVVTAAISANSKTITSESRNFRTGAGATINTPGLVTIDVASPFSLALSVSGVESATVTWSATGLPANLEVTEINDRWYLSGVASIPGTYASTLFVRDATGFSASKLIRFVVASRSVHVSSVAEAYFRPLSDRKTEISWVAGAEGEPYVVLVNGIEMCSTTASSCVVEGTFGPNTGITVQLASAKGSIELPKFASYTAPTETVVLASPSLRLLSGSLTKASKSALGKAFKSAKAGGFETILVTPGNTQAERLAARAAFWFLKRAAAKQPVHIGWSPVVGLSTQLITK